jgi:plastocyanin
VGTVRANLRAALSVERAEAKIMLFGQIFRSEMPRLWVVVAALALIGGAGWAVASITPHQVSQAGRLFRPAEITIKRGEVVELLNDDGDLLHHAYIDSDRMNFDSGDLRPGARTSIKFSVAGDFLVLCAIHPKMKLVVHVK